jgi:hypothetical protein
MSFVRFVALQRRLAVGAEETKTSLRGYCYPNREKLLGSRSGICSVIGLSRCLSDSLPVFDSQLSIE